MQKIMHSLDSWPRCKSVIEPPLRRQIQAVQPIQTYQQYVCGGVFRGWSNRVRNQRLGLRWSRSEKTLAVFGTDAATVTREAPGMSSFALEDGVVYHTYSAYTRGLDGLWGMYQWLDRAPRGRNETMIQGMGDLRGPFWFRRHDEYRRGLSQVLVWAKLWVSWRH